MFCTAKVNKNDVRASVEGSLVGKDVIIVCLRAEVTECKVVLCSQCRELLVIFEVASFSRALLSEVKGRIVGIYWQPWLARCAKTCIWRGVPLKGSPLWISRSPDVVIGVVSVARLRAADKSDKKSRSKRNEKKYLRISSVFPRNAIAKINHSNLIAIVRYSDTRQ